MKKVVIVDVTGAICVKDAPENLSCKWMSEQIGCEWIEIVRPKNIARGYVIIVDEEGRLKDNFINVAGSWMYETNIHGEPIVGDIMIVREVIGDEGPELDGMDEEMAEQFASDLGNPINLMNWEEQIRIRLA